MKGKVVVIGCVITVLLASDMLYQHIMQARREAIYETSIAPLKRDLSRGMTKADVEQYLTARHIEHNHVGEIEGERIEIQIGEEPGSLFCEPWRVYAALEFNEQSHLTDIHIVKVGTCL